MYGKTRFTAEILLLRTAVDSSVDEKINSFVMFITHGFFHLCWNRNKYFCE